MKPTTSRSSRKPAKKKMTSIVTFRRAFLATTLMMGLLMMYSYVHSTMLVYNRFLTYVGDGNGEILESFDLPSNDYSHSKDIHHHSAQHQQQQDQPQRVLLEEHDTTSKQKQKQNQPTTTSLSPPSTTSSASSTSLRGKTTSSTSSTKKTSKHSSSTEKHHQPSSHHHHGGKKDHNMPTTATASATSSTKTTKKEHSSSTSSTAAAKEHPSEEHPREKKEKKPTTTSATTATSKTIEKQQSSKEHHRQREHQEKKPASTTTTSSSSSTTKKTSKHSSSSTEKQLLQQQLQQQTSEQPEKKDKAATTTTSAKKDKSTDTDTTSSTSSSATTTSSAKTTTKKHSSTTNTAVKDQPSEQQQQLVVVVETKKEKPAAAVPSTPTTVTTTTTTTSRASTTTRKTQRSTSTTTASSTRKSLSSKKKQPRDLPPRLQLLEEWHHFDAYRKSSEQGKKFPDYIRGKYRKERDVVLSTHTSVDNDKLNRVDILQKYWQGPISLAVRIRSEIEINKFFDFFEELPAEVADVWTVHFVFENALAFDRAGKTFAAQYCHNALRNLAMHSPAIPDYVLSVDLDFFPTFGGYPKLMEILNEFPSMWDKMKRDKTLFVIPVMEVLHIPNKWGYSAKTESRSLIGTLREIDSTPKADRTKAHEKLIQDLKSLEIYERGVESDLPKSRDDLKLLYKYGAAREWHHKPGHAPTNLNKYWKYGKPKPGKKTGRVDANQMSYKIKPSYKYEPYFVGYKPAMPKFWESFRGYGLNKQAFVRECILAGFDMEALFELYLTHLAHPSNNNKDIKKINEVAWDNEFQHHLEINYEKPKWDLGGKWWYADPTFRPDRPKYVTKLRQEQYGDQ